MSWSEKRQMSMGKASNPNLHNSSLTRAVPAKISRQNLRGKGEKENTFFHPKFFKEDGLPEFLSALVRCLSETTDNTPCARATNWPSTSEFCPLFHIVAHFGRYASDL